MKSDKNKQIALERIKKARENRSLFLDLSMLNLNELPDDISDLNNLVELDLSYNFFSEIPQSVVKLCDLKKLNISNNYLISADFIDGVYYNLEELDISSNLLYTIPESLSFLHNCERILFHENPFLGQLPISISHYDIRYLQDFLKLNIYTEKERLYETKLIFVGKGEVGKTTLMKVIKDDAININCGTEETTHGINIDSMELDVFFPARPPHYTHHYEMEYVYQVFDQEDIENYEFEYDYRINDKYYSRFLDTFQNYCEEDQIEIMMLENLGSDFEVKKTVTTNLWDFGGQEIYHSTHQFFLTKRSIYIFVWEPRKDGIEEEFEYWLNIINLLGQRSPVIIVMNKADIRYVSIDEKRYKEIFPNIAGFLQTSCLDKSGISLLKESITNCIRTLPHLGEELPKSWLEIRNKLSHDHRDYMFMTDFRKLCNESISSISSRHLELISDYLHDIGSVIHFKNSPVLRNIIIINPQWATKAVYSLIDCIAIQKKYGVFNILDMENHLDLNMYPVETHIQLLELMERFEICFKTVGSADTFILPELLKNEVPDNDTVQGILSDKSAFKFKYSFIFMPGGMLSRLICKLFYLLNSENYWKSGVIFNYESTSALVSLDKLSKTLSIYIVGENKRDLFGLIKNELNQIFKVFNMEENKDFYEEIPCNCSVCIIDSSPFYFKNNTLKSFLDKGKNTIDCYKSALTVNINDLLFLYRNSNINKNIIYDILSAISKLQGLNKSVEKSEDSRNTFISNELSHLGLISKDQSKWGSSASGISMGEIDVRIDTKDGQFLTFYEGLNLEYLNKTVIQSHISKVINKYDSLGISEKFIGCYCTVTDFSNLTISYLEFLQNFPPEITSFTDIFDVTTEFTQHTEIRIFKTFYIKSGRKTSLTHILVNLK